MPTDRSSATVTAEAQERIAVLPERGVVAATGRDARKLLHGVLTCDIERLQPGQATLGALLTPQGKLLFEMLVLATGDGFLLDTSAANASELVKRLGMYKLRAEVVIEDVSAKSRVVVHWPGRAPEALIAASLANCLDPRDARLGHRLIMATNQLGAISFDAAATAAWHALRITLGVAEAGADYPLGDTFPHEANYDRSGGVSFTKGCYVGQEVVARMEHKTVVRKRVVALDALDAAASLVSGADVTVGEVSIGKLGSVDGRRGIALVRLDRVVEMLDKGGTVQAGGVPVAIDAEALAEHRARVAARAEVGPGA